MSSLKLNAATGGGSVALTGPNSTTSNLAVSLKLPVADGSANQILKTDGSGQLGWATDNSGISLSGSTNNTIATVTGANALQGESNLTYNGNTFSQAISNAGNGMDVFGAGDHWTSYVGSSNRSAANVWVSKFAGQWNRNDIASIACMTGADTTNKDEGQLAFYTTPSGGSETERLRITSAGRLGIGVAAPDGLLHVYAGDSGGSSAVANGVTIENSGLATLQFLSPNNVGNQIRFGDPQDNGAGWIQYVHTDNRLDIGCNGSEKLRITSAGDVEVKNGDLDIETAGKGVKFPNSSFTESSVNMHLNIASGNNDFYVQSGGTTFAAFKGQSKDLQVTSGNLVIGTSGKGIDFSATSHYNTSGDGEVLTTYEEGTWTPQPMFGGANTGMTYTSRTGTYVRVGKMVTAYYEIIFTSKGSSTGHFQIGGFPWANSQTEMVNNSFGYFHRFIFGADSTYMITCNLSGTTSGWRYAVHGTSSSGINMAVVTNAHVSDGTHVSGALVYRTS